MTRARKPPPPPKVPRVPFLHGDQLPDGSVYCASWDAFLARAAFIAAAPLAVHLTRYRRRVEWLQRNKRQAAAARPNALARLLFGRRGEPTTLRDLQERQARIMDRHIAGQCVACGLPLPPEAAELWACKGCES